MKKIICITLALILILCTFAACSKSDKTTAQPNATATDALVGELKTMDDAINLEGANYSQWGQTNDVFVYVFELEGSTYRVMADYSGDIPEEFFSADFSTAEGKKVMSDLVGALALTKVENLSAATPTQEELDAYIGKTGQELLDAGFDTGGGMFEENTFFLSKGVYAFEAVVQEDVGPQGDEYNETELFSDKTIKSITCTGIGDATNVDEQL